jgi:hypothetical protein
MLKQDPTLQAKGAGGRPPKFAEPSRPVTLTLPESTLAALQRINPDRSRAIVELTKKASHETAKHALVEIIAVAKDTALVVVGPSKALRKMPFLRLVEVAPSRFLLTFEPGHNFHDLEIAIGDALDDEQYDKRERELLIQLVGHLKGLRKSQRVSMAEILVIKPQ